MKKASCLGSLLDGVLPPGGGLVQRYIRPQTGPIKRVSFAIVSKLMPKSNRTKRTDAALVALYCPIIVRRIRPPVGVSSHPSAPQFRTTVVQKVT